MINNKIITERSNSGFQNHIQFVYLINLMNHSKFD